MKPLKLELQGIGPYREKQEIDFSSLSRNKIFLITGETGSGKTIIIDGITYAIYGKSSGSLRPDLDTNSLDEIRCNLCEDSEDTYVILTCEVNGKIYRLERRFTKKVKNYAEEYSISVQDDTGKFAPLCEKFTKKIMNEEAKKLVGDMDYDTFRQVIILPQGQFEKFLVAESKEKEQILSTIFNVEKWDNVISRINEKVSKKRKEYDGHQNELKYLLGDYENIDDKKSSYARTIKELDELKTSYEKANYEGQTQSWIEHQNNSTMFASLEKNQSRLMELKSNREVNRIEKFIERIKISEAADKLIPDFNSLDEKIINYNQRKKAHREISIEEEKNSSILKKLQIEKDKVNIKKTEYEEKRKKINELSNKKETYSKIEQIKKDLDTANRQYQAKNSLLDNEESKEKKQKEELDSLREKWKLTCNEYTDYFNRYTKNIAGTLARDLIEGIPCPVCGSTSHPSLAMYCEEDITKDILEGKEKSRNILEEKVKKKSEEVRKISEDIGLIRIDVATLKAVIDEKNNSYQELLKNKEEGIDNRSDLEKSITIINEEITKYDKECEEKNNNYKKHKEKQSKIEALLKIANDELEKAKEECENAEGIATVNALKLGFDSKEQAKEGLISDKEKSSLKKEIDNYNSELKACQQNISDMENELKDKEKHSKQECEIVLKNIRRDSKEHEKNINSLEVAIDREKRNIDKYDELYAVTTKEGEVLKEEETFLNLLRGSNGIGIKRYVLGIMFGEVIRYANEMLQKVHGGRYQLFRRDTTGKKNERIKGLALAVKDNRSSSIGGRAVSSLSGGEKFLVSLALSIGLSTIAQKNGNSLGMMFIDEGFGSLDEESIKDAMNILESISKNENLVGIISHIDLLRSNIEVKLEIDKTIKGSYIKDVIG